MIGRFLKDTGFSFAGQVGSILFGLASSIIIARVLGPENRGVLAIVVLLPLTINALVASGFSATVVHSIAAGSWRDSEIVPRLLGIWLYLSAIMIAVGTVALSYHEALFPGTPFGLLVYSVSLMPATLLQACTSCILAGKRAFKQQMYANLIGAPVGLLLTVVLVWWLDLGVFGAITAQLAGTILTIAINALWVPGLLQTDRIRLQPNLSLRELKASLSFGLKSHIANLSAFLNYRVDQFLVNGMLGSGSVGVYTVAVNNAERLWILVGNFAQVLFPSASAKQDDPQRFASFTARLAASMLLLLAIVGGLMMLVAEFVVVLLYGEPFRSAGEVIVWLVPGIVALGHSKILANYVAGRGRPDINAVRGVMALAINVVANLFLIPRYGIIGAAAATSISYSVSAFAGYLAFLRIAGVKWSDPLVPPFRELVGLIRKLLRKSNSSIPSGS